MMRTLLVEAAQTAARLDEELRRAYGRLKAQNAFGSGQGHGRAQAGRPDVLDAAGKQNVRRVVRAASGRSYAGQLGSFCGRTREADRLSEHPASLKPSGSSE